MSSHDHGERRQHTKEQSRYRLARLPESRHWPIIPIIGLALALVIGLVVRVSPWLVLSQVNLATWLRAHSNPFADWVALVLGEVFSPLGAVIILILLTVWIGVVRHAPVNASAILLGVAFGWLPCQIYKWIVRQDRIDPQKLPHPVIHMDTDTSYPSGHTAFVVALALMLYFLLSSTRWRGLTAILGWVAVILLVWGRTYIAAHYLSDTIGGVVVAYSGVTLFAGLWNRFGIRILSRVTPLRRLGPVPNPSPR